MAAGKEVHMHFEKAFQSLLTKESGSPEWLLGLRRQSFEAFNTIGFPSRQNEDWKYTSTRALADGDFSLPEIANIARANLAAASLSNASRLVFINGIYEPSQSNPPEGVEISPIDRAQIEDEAIIRSTLTSSENLALLNQAFFTSGVLIKVAKKKDLEAPIQLLYLQTESSTPAMISPRNLIFVEAQARVAFLESHYGEGGHFTNAVSDVFVKDGAECQYVLERVLKPQNSFVSSHTFHVGRDARIESFNLALGGQLNRSHLIFRMTAEGASAKLDGLYIAPDQSHIDNVTEVVHLAPNTSSAQLYKGVLEGKSRAVFNGKITIVKDAQKVDAQQLNKNLLMSADAEVDSRPQLVIDANDVKCSHGATIGQIDSQELFYLQSRAISKDDAKRMLAKAFIGDVMGRIKHPSLRKHLETSLENFGSRV
ncbi:MAG: Fe-S cluster assembly protein SufD [Bdellovibrionota bacterium]